MRTDYDFAPFYRATVGFDRIFEMLDSMAGQPATSGYPPYNIEKSGDDDYTITMAVAGFSDHDINITAQNDRLTVAGRIEDKKEDGTEYLHRGIALRAFERSFRLADHMQVKTASLKDGLLRINLVREVPEAAKPRLIPITQ